MPADDAALGVAAAAAADDRVYASCVASRRDLHIDPYGGVAHCCFIKDPALRFSLRGPGGIAPGALERIWQQELPAVGDRACGGREYLEGCASCDLRDDCRWCGVYGYLEHRRHGAKVEYLCEVAREARRFKDEWRREHRRTWQIGGMTVQVDADRPIAQGTFSEKFRTFEAPDADGAAAGADGLPVIRLRHHFDLPDLHGRELGREMYRKPPWAVYRQGSSWIYLGISPNDDGGGVPGDLHRVVTFNDDHTRARIYNDVTRSDAWARGGLASVTMFPTDQILLARVLADRDGLFLHSGAVVLDGAGLCFIGHSEAGKSTTMSLLTERLGERVEVLCDDRNVVRYWSEGPPPVPSQAAGPDAGGAAAEASGDEAVLAPSGFWVHGTWSHGTVPLVSASQAPLRALVFLRQDECNEIVRLTDRKDVTGRILACIIRPFVTADWWHKTFDVVERLVATVPAYEMRFDKSGAIVPEIEALAGAVGESTDR